MRKVNLLLLSLFVFASSVIAQEFDSPGKYMDAMSAANRESDQKYMAYMSASSHGKRARKVEKLRLQVLESLNATKTKIMDLPYYKGDKELRQSYLDYLSVCYSVFNDDYAKIVNKEEIAEQSFDEMQAYLLMKEKVDEKIQEACKKVNQADKDFAAKFKVNLITGEKDKLGLKMETASKVDKYYKPIHLIFFKCNWQDNVLTKALNEGRVNDVEQTRSAVIKYADDGLMALKAIQPYEGDRSLIDACKKALEAFKSISEVDVPIKTDYQLKKENFEKIKKAYEAKSQSAKTKEDVDAYNKAVNDFNAAVKASNESSNNSNKKRTEGFKAWEDAQKAFFDKYVPYYR